LVKTRSCTTHGGHAHDVQPSNIVVSQKKVPYVVYSYSRSEASWHQYCVFLEPLMQDMAKLLNEGVHMWDQYQQEYFMLYEIIFVCIHDAPRGFTVSGQTKGKSGACLVCVDGTV
jgi:hypothetical protein